MWKCEPCDKFFSGVIPYQAHLNSVKHIKKVGAVQTPECASVPLLKTDQKEYMCHICNIKLNSRQQAEAHFSGEKHKQLLLKTSLSQAKDAMSMSDVFYSESNMPKNSLNEDIMSHIRIFGVDEPIQF